jgi:hypothetical protein
MNEKYDDLMNQREAFITHRSIAYNRLEDIKGKGLLENLKHYREVKELDEVIKISDKNIIELTSDLAYALIEKTKPREDK